MFNDLDIEPFNAIIFLEMNISWIEQIYRHRTNFYEASILEYVAGQNSIGPSKESKVLLRTDRAKIWIGSTRLSDL